MSHNTARKIRLSWKLIAVIRRNHTELVPGWNFAPVFKRPVTREISDQGEITPAYDEIFVSSHTFNPKWNFERWKAFSAL